MCNVLFVDLSRGYPHLIKDVKQDLDLSGDDTTKVNMSLTSTEKSYDTKCICIVAQTKKTQYKFTAQIITSNVAAG